MQVAGEPLTRFEEASAQPRTRDRGRCGRGSRGERDRAQQHGEEQASHAPLQRTRGPELAADHTIRHGSQGQSSSDASTRVPAPSSAPPSPRRRRRRSRPAPGDSPRTPAARPFVAPVRAPANAPVRVVERGGPAPAREACIAARRHGPRALGPAGPVGCRRRGCARARPRRIGAGRGVRALPGGCGVLGPGTRALTVTGRPGDDHGRGRGCDRVGGQRVGFRGLCRDGDVEIGGRRQGPGQPVEGHHGRAEQQHARRGSREAACDPESAMNARVVRIPLCLDIGARSANLSVATTSWRQTLRQRWRTGCRAP